MQQGQEKPCSPRGQGSGQADRQRRPHQPLPILYGRRCPHLRQGRQRKTYINLFSQFFISTYNDSPRGYAIRAGFVLCNKKYCGGATAKETHRTKWNCAPTAISVHGRLMHPHTYGKAGTTTNLPNQRWDMLGNCFFEKSQHFYMLLW